MASMVVISRPTTPATGVTHERTTLPSTSTEQAPHWARPQPYLVPVMPGIADYPQQWRVGFGLDLIGLLVDT